jgi:DNA end-binding protein Ku
MRERQHLAAVRPYGKGLALSTMLFADEVVAQSDVPDVPSRKPSLAPREKKLAAQIVDALANEWDPKRYHDDYEEHLRGIIKAKQKGKVVEAEPEPESAKVLDLMEALRASLDQKPKRGGAKRAAKKRSAKKTTKRTTKRTAKPTRTTSRKTTARRSA